MACYGIDAVLELDALAVDPFRVERRRFSVPPGPEGIAIDEASGARGRLLADGGRGHGDRARRRRRRPPPRRARLPPGSSPRCGRARKAALLPHRRRSHLLRRHRLLELPHRRARGRPHVDDADGSTADADARRPARVDGAVRVGRRQGDLGRLHLRTRSCASGARGSRPPEIEDLRASCSLPGCRRQPRAPCSPAAGERSSRTPRRDAPRCHTGGSTDASLHAMPPNAHDSQASFDTPSLRFIRGTAPYFHDGRYPTLEALLADPREPDGPHGGASGGRPCRARRVSEDPVNGSPRVRSRRASWPPGARRAAPPCSRRRRRLHAPRSPRSSRPSLRPSRTHPRRAAPRLSRGTSPAGDPRPRSRVDRLRRRLAPGRHVGRAPEGSRLLAPEDARRRRLGPAHLHDAVRRGPPRRGRPHGRARTRRPSGSRASREAGSGEGMPPACGPGHTGQRLAVWRGIAPAGWTDDGVDVEMEEGDYDLSTCAATPKRSLHGRAIAVVRGYVYALLARDEADDDGDADESVVVFLPPGRWSRPRPIRRCRSRRATRDPSRGSRSRSIRGEPARPVCGSTRHRSASGRGSGRPGDRSGNFPDPSSRPPPSKDLLLGVDVAWQGDVSAGVDLARFAEGDRPQAVRAALCGREAPARLRAMRPGARASPSRRRCRSRSCAPRP